MKNGRILGCFFLQIKLHSICNQKSGNQEVIGYLPFPKVKISQIQICKKQTKSILKLINTFF